MSATSTSVVSVIRKVPVFLEAIKIEHAAFTLPFAYLAMLLAADGLPTLWQFIWVSVAMTAGRTAAMSLNRIIDRHLDSRNPRTAIRALPQGILTPQFMWGASIVALAIMVLAAAMLNPLCALLSPVAIFWLVAYSYTKRFTWLSHFALGVSGSMAPMGGWIAVTGEFAWSTVLLGAAVITWMAGFDMIYACQDYDIDLREGLYSVPARFGIPGALHHLRPFPHSHRSVLGGRGPATRSRPVLLARHRRHRSPAHLGTPARQPPRPLPHQHRLLPRQ